MIALWLSVATFTKIHLPNYFDSFAFSSFSLWLSIQKYCRRNRKILVDVHARVIFSFSSSLSRIFFALTLRLLGPSSEYRFHVNSLTYTLESVQHSAFPYKLRGSLVRSTGYVFCIERSHSPKSIAYGTKTWPRRTSHFILGGSDLLARHLFRSPSLFFALLLLLLLRWTP